MLTVNLERLNLSPGDRVLDLGCGRGRHLHAVAQYGALAAVGLDLDFDDVRDARDAFAWAPDARDWGVLQGDALKTPFADGSFDAVVCSEVLEHLPDYEAALAEIARVLRPHGVLAVSVPRAWPEAICWRLSEAYQNEPGGHVRIFKANELARATEAAGFRETGRRHHEHGLHSPYWWLKCAMWRRRDDHPVIRAYQRFLEWDILKRPLLTRALAALADPVMGKSVVMYFTREGAAT